MTTQIKEVRNQEEFLTEAMSKTLRTALKRFEVKVFLDWNDNEADEIFYVEFTSKVSGKRTTFTKSFFESSRNLNKVLDKLNLIGNVEPSTHSALVDYIHDLIDAGKFIIGGYSSSNTNPLEWDKQVAMRHARLVVRYYLLNESRFVLQSSKSYDSSKHLGVILDKETDLPEGVIAVGFKGSTLQSVLNPLGRIQSQQYRREILGGLAHIGVLDADIAEYDEEDDDVNMESEVEGYFDGYSIINGKIVKDSGKQSQKKKSPRLDKQRIVSEDKNGVKFYIFHFSESLLKEMAQYVA
ncbi:hypothetical protein J41TS12_36800 [Paenibacillus antibioticophila]|uniref:Uncharacterized protein n=1 Tax=Paenibacillus antibioticophila TaxID=1274374 RepID=A0A919XVM9_9BACL|nr:hypothetical protein [Paenibacillus antibioticophila]GIO38819.1 hypothetical protein J41TS12_36800 [Paenibacillus antibioticophila]